jgi:hypothetical protein
MRILQNPCGAKAQVYFLADSAALTPLSKGGDHFPFLNPLGAQETGFATASRNARHLPRPLG